MKFIDLRSDTVTLPAAPMKAAMFTAPLGDDVFGDDPTVNALQAKAATLFGMESALFCSSGTQTNQLAIRVHTAPGEEVICDALSHVYLYEGGGIAANSLASVALISGDYGRITAQQVEAAVNNPADIHRPVSRLVVLENTMNKGGGCYYDFAEIIRIREVCDKHGLRLHLDGARLFNALVETPETPADYGRVFDSISICLSKGLGCPIGSLLIGNQEVTQKARRYRKLMGGGWRQAGILAAAGIYALDHHVERLKDDHRRARQIGEILSECSFVERIYDIPTNIVIFQIPENYSSEQFVAEMNTIGIGCVSFGKHLVRMVTHLDFTDEQLEMLNKRLKSFNLSAA